MRARQHRMCDAAAAGLPPTTAAASMLLPLLPLPLLPLLLGVPRTCEVEAVGALLDEQQQHLWVLLATAAGGGTGATRSGPGRLAGPAVGRGRGKGNPHQ